MWAEPRCPGRCARLRDALIDRFFPLFNRIEERR
jgi:hypothetical protein